MSSATIETITRMLESLPDAAQDRAVEHLREYLEEMTDEIRWEDSFVKSADKLAEVAGTVRQQFKDGETEAFDLERL